ncbi:type II toxin-antitoxin system YafO family toxin [Xenorhabdus szentirmaii]|uniref:type II toxin-antitoxin system YafO family toxin n=1 Tax=Xenorhabdus szentirmaii TaxID=290112 RepID=UPI00199D7FCF|nr:MULTISPECIES: type II toxin-antitoxin system YafO family toxin [unclassified Xenorhabdus]MBD2791643.1 type II toxin-antitoxin system YafO family toxin [Xenorhabdus sp. CUL]MBD2826871.1 type II toxin-antitoxin system YafO family toxin [Xenorhabdus sp. 5]
MDKCVSVIVYAESERLEIFFAKALADFLNRNKLSGYLGKLGGFERNPHSNAAGIYKAHVRIPVLEQPWNKAVRQPQRSSDSFLIYAVHRTYPIHIQIIGVITPNAHEKMDKLISTVIEMVEGKFQCLRETELKSLNSYS